MKLGCAIKAIRKDRGLLLDELADMTGTTSANLSRIEAGQWPRPELLEALADALNVKIYQLFARAEGVTLPTSDETSSERKVLTAYRLMEPEARYHLEAVADALVTVNGRTVVVQVKESKEAPEPETFAAKQSLSPKK